MSTNRSIMVENVLVFFTFSFFFPVSNPPIHQGGQVPKNKKRPNLTLSSLKKAKFSNGENCQIKAKFSKKIYQNISNKFWYIIKCWMFHWNSAKIGLKIYYFLQDWNKAKKRPNGQIILFLENFFKKGQMATLRFTSSLWQFDIDRKKETSKKKEKTFFVKWWKVRRNPWANPINGK